MTAAPIAFKSNPGQYQFLGTTQVINGHAEKLGDDAKGQLAVIPSEGLVELVTNGTTPNRGLIYLPDLDKAYAVHGSGCYKITHSAGVFTSAFIGIVPGNDQVQLSRNQKTDVEVVVRSDYGLQVISSDSISDILDEDLPDDVVTAEYVGGYHAYGLEDRRFFLSALNSAKLIEGLDFATFEQRAGKHIRIVENAGEMIGFCDKWLEFWRKVENADFPFAPIAFKARGLLAPDAVVSCDNTLFFPGDDNNIHKLNNYDPQIVSTHEISRLIQEDASPSAIIGFGWDRGGHKFANFSGTNWTRCFDAATGVWHSRQSYGRDTWRARNSMSAWGKSIVGDSISGKLFYHDKDTFTEDGQPIIWGVDSPPLHVFPNGGICDAVHFDLATGYGTLSGQGSNPKVMLEVSKDGGNQFQQYRELSLGIRGTYATRVTARRLGQFGPKGIVFRLRVSDPVVRALVGCDVDVRPLKK